MLNEKEIQELQDSIKKALKELDPDNEHFKTVFESQIYVLNKVLN